MNTWPIVDMRLGANGTIEGSGALLGYARWSQDFERLEYLWFDAGALSTDLRPRAFVDLFEDGREAVRWLADVQVAYAQYGPFDTCVEPVWLAKEPRWAHTGMARP